MVADEIARTVWPYVEGGRLRPVIDSIFPLDKPTPRMRGWKRASMSGRSCSRSGDDGQLVLHEYSLSGNCYKVRLTAALVGNAARARANMTS